MKISHISSMVRGWFVGDFEPSLARSQHVEVAMKQYKKGETEAAHFHKISREISVVAKGLIKINGYDLIEGDVLVLEPGDPMTGLYAEQDTNLLVVKYPSAENDKYDYHAEEQTC